MTNDHPPCSLTPPGWTEADRDAARLEGWAIDVKVFGDDRICSIVALSGGRLAPYIDDTALCYVEFRARLGSELHRRAAALQTHTERTEEGAQCAKVRLLADALQGTMSPTGAHHEEALAHARAVLGLVEAK